MRGSHWMLPLGTCDVFAWRPIDWKRPPKIESNDAVYGGEFEITGTSMRRPNTMLKFGFGVHVFSTYAPYVTPCG